MPVVVRLPLAAYTCSSLPDASAVYFRLTKSNMVPPGWTASLLESDGPSLAVCKLRTLPPLYIVDVTFVLTVAAQCTWTLRIGDKEINLQQSQLLAGIAAQLCSVDEVVQLLSTLDTSKILCRQC